MKCDGGNLKRLDSIQNIICIVSQQWMNGGASARKCNECGHMITCILIYKLRIQQLAETGSIFVREFTSAT